MAVQASGRAATVRAHRRRRVRRLTRRDRVILALMIGIPILLDLAMIWGPAIATIFLSFTNSSGAAPVKYVGTKNYHFMTHIDPQFWPAVRHNIIWLLVFLLVATPFGCCSRW